MHRRLSWVDRMVIFPLQHGGKVSRLSRNIGVPSICLFLSLFIMGLSPFPLPIVTFPPKFLFYFYHSYFFFLFRGSILIFTHGFSSFTKCYGVRASCYREISTPLRLFLNGSDTPKNYLLFFLLFFAFPAHRDQCFPFCEFEFVSSLSAQSVDDAQARHVLCSGFLASSLSPIGLTRTRATQLVQIKNENQKKKIFCMSHSLLFFLQFVGLQLARIRNGHLGS